MLGSNLLHELGQGPFLLQASPSLFIAKMRFPPALRIRPPAHPHLAKAPTDAVERNNRAPWPTDHRKGHFHMGTEGAPGPTCPAWPLPLA